MFGGGWRSDAEGFVEGGGVRGGFEYAEDGVSVGYMRLRESEIFRLLSRSLDRRLVLKVQIVRSNCL